VIDIYRSPIERKMSEFFEKLCDFHFNNKDSEVKNYKIDRIIKRFNDVFNHIGLGDHYIDKYDIPKIDNFDIKNKYLMQKVCNVTYIKLRLKDSLEWSKFLTDILGKKIYIIKDYETDNKDIGELYRKFKTEYKLPLNHYESIINDKYLKLYYSEEERSDYLKEWLKKTCDSCNTWSKNEYDFYKNISIENQKENNIQRHHYVDLGCTCRYCSEKRIYIMRKVMQGEDIKEKIIHEELVKNDRYNVLKKIKEMENKKVKKNKLRLGLLHKI
jgi:hypothetical protein